MLIQTPRDCFSLEPSWSWEEPRWLITAIFNFRDKTFGDASLGCCLGVLLFKIGVLDFNIATHGQSGAFVDTEVMFLQIFCLIIAFVTLIIVVDAVVGSNDLLLGLLVVMQMSGFGQFTVTGFCNWWAGKSTTASQNITARLKQKKVNKIWFKCLLLNSSTFE